jgi:hypothetical protein
MSMHRAFCGSIVTSAGVPPIADLLGRSVWNNQALVPISASDFSLIRNNTLNHQLDLAVILVVSGLSGSSASAFRKLVSAGGGATKVLLLPVRPKREPERRSHARGVQNLLEPGGPPGARCGRGAPQGHGPGRQQRSRRRPCGDGFSPAGKVMSPERHPLPFLAQLSAVEFALRD